MNTIQKTTQAKGTALITGASSGIGAIYADRLAKRGHNLILVARNKQRLASLARRIANDTGRKVDTVEADLTSPADLKRVEHILRTNASISMLVNNAGTAAVGPLVTSDVDRSKPADRFSDVRLIRRHATERKAPKAQALVPKMAPDGVELLAPERKNSH